MPAIRAALPLIPAIARLFAHVRGGLPGCSTTTPDVDVEGDAIAAFDG